MADTIFDDVRELVAARTPVITTEQARERRRQARRTILGEFTDPTPPPSRIARDSTTVTRRETDGGDGAGEIFDSGMQTTFDLNLGVLSGLNPLDVARTAQLSTDPFVQAGGFLGGLFPAPFSGLLGGIGGVAAGLTERGRTIDVPFSNRAFVGLGQGRATTISELAPGATSTISGGVRGETDVTPGGFGTGGFSTATREVTPGGFAGAPTAVGATELAPGSFAPEQEGFADLGDDEGPAGPGEAGGVGMGGGIGL